METEQKLRLGIAGVARALHLDPYLHVPGHPVDWSLEALTAAVREPRGWNVLLGQIVAIIEQKEDRRNNMIERIMQALDEGDTN